MSKTPTDVFKAFQDKQVLIKIAEEKLPEVNDKIRKYVVSNLATHVTYIGLRQVFTDIHFNLLQQVAERVPHYDGKKKHNKAHIVNKIMEYTENDGAEKLLKSIDAALLDKIIDDLRIEPAAGLNTVELFLQEADTCGMQVLFSSYSVEQMKKFADTCGLTVESASREILIDCLIAQNDYKAPKNKKKKKEPKPSKHKPDIKKGISKIDLHSHYTLEELSEYCKSNGLKVSGLKKDIIQRILDHLDGKPQVEKPKKRKASGTPKKGKSSPKKKAKTTTSEDQAEKSEKTENENSENAEKSEKSDKTEKEASGKTEETGKTKKAEK